MYHSLLTCTIITQDAIKGYHRANTQATLHAHVYYLNLEGVGLTHGSYVVINSDCNIHDAVAVHKFQRQLVEFLMSNLSSSYILDNCPVFHKYNLCKSCIVNFL